MTGCALFRRRRIEQDLLAVHLAQSFVTVRATHLLVSAFKRERRLLVIEL